MKPIFLFIDCSYYESQCFHFESEPLTSIADLAVQGYVRLLVPKITDQEVIKRISLGGDAAIASLREARKKCSLTLGVEMEPFSSTSRYRRMYDARRRGWRQHSRFATHANGDRLMHFGGSQGSGRSLFAKREAWPRTMWWAPRYSVTDPAIRKA